MSIFSEYINTYAQEREAKRGEKLFNSFYGANAVIIVDH
jgi:hypothetical protein